MEVSSRPAEFKAISVADIAREFVAYYTHRGGCSNCGGLPHSASCFVGRFLEVLAVDRPSLRSPGQRQPPRSEELLRKTLDMLCHFVWHGHTRPGEHMWSIPVDFERDFDCILSGAIDELVRLRVAMQDNGADLVKASS